MLKKFTTKQLIFIALMAALVFVLNFSLGGWIIALSGIPGSSAFLTGITNALIYAFVIFTIKKFGAGGLFYLTYGLITLPTNMGGGPPGFIWKVFVLALAGLILDIFIFGFKFKLIGIILACVTGSAVGLYGLLLFFYLLGLPEFNKLAPVINFMYLIWIFLAFAGFYLGYLLHKKLKNKSIIKQFSS